MTIAIPTTAETFQVQVVEDERGVLHLLPLRPRVDYLLAAVLKIGWRLVDTTPAERVLLEQHEFASGVRPASRRD